MIKASSTVGLCFKDEAPTVEEALYKCFHLSKSQIKKQNFSANFLKKKVYAKMECHLPIDLINDKKINPEYTGTPLDIIYEDDSFLVLNKKIKVHSHPLNYSDTENCLSFLAEKGYDKILKVNFPNYDRGLLYRLDYETSGVLVYMKKESDLKLLRENFRNQIKEKKYWAIVQGDFDKEGDYRHFFKPSGPKGQKMQVFEEEKEGSFEGFLSIIKKSFNAKKNISLVEVELITGLRHQIRAQLAFLGYPILGDELYAGVSHHPRLFLHAHHYAVMLEQKEYVFNAPVDESFSITLD
ncbi:MAG: RluA family pseudouridine synthase [Bacteriovoracaceae bacterium]|nr:RluA family pseudouridine synthase [Bacteriovoracaceae bacterium]